MASAWGNSWGLSWLNSWGTISTGDTHDGGFYDRWWKKQREKKKPPTIEEIIEVVQENPVEALKAVPKVKKKFIDVDYTKVKQNADIALFIAQELMILLEIKRLEDEEDAIIEMLLLL
jgi:hypothetical protein